MDTPKSAFIGISNDMPSYLQSSFCKVAETPKSRPQGKRIIESKIGISQESPTYFRTEHGAISSDTYKNPFISGKPDESNISPLKNKQTFSIFNKLRDDQKKDFFHIKEVQTQPIYNLLTHQKTDIGKIELQINERPKFNDEYKKLQDSTSTPFHRKTNQFSDFVERNDVMNVYGHLNQRERPTQFKRVKDYSLDQNQLDTIKTIRENSQPSRFSKSSISVLTPRLVQNNNLTSDSFIHQNNSAIVINAGKKSLFNQGGNNTNIEGNNNEIESELRQQQQYQQQNKFGQSHNNSNKEDLDILQKSKKMKTMQSSSQNINVNSNTTRYPTHHSQESYPNNNTSTSILPYTNQEITPSPQLLLYTSYSRPHYHKVPHKIIQTKYDKLKEEESAQELKCIDEFEQHLRFIQGNNFGGCNQGSVFFKDSKRR